MPLQGGYFGKISFKKRQKKKADIPAHNKQCLHFDYATQHIENVTLQQCLFYSFTGEKRKIIQPQSLKDPKLEELKTVTLTLVLVSCWTALHSLFDWSVGGHSSVMGVHLDVRKACGSEDYWRIELRDSKT